MSRGDRRAASNPLNIRRDIGPAVEVNGKAGHPAEHCEEISIRHGEVVSRQVFLLLKCLLDEVETLEKPDSEKLLYRFRQFLVPHEKFDLNGQSQRVQACLPLIVAPTGHLRAAAHSTPSRRQGRSPAPKDTADAKHVDVRGRGEDRDERCFARDRFKPPRGRRHGYPPACDSGRSCRPVRSGHRRRGIGSVYRLRGPLIPGRPAPQPSHRRQEYA